MTPTPHGQVPEALRLAEEISNLVCSSEAAAKTIAAAADELCRLHVENASLRAQQPASPPAEQQAAPKAAPGVGNSGFDHQTAADFLSGKTVSDEAVRKFVAESRWAHNERAALSATLLAMHGVLTSREAEIALLKKALLEAEAAPQPAPAPLSESIDQLARKLEIIGVVGVVDGHDVVRRESVLEIARRAAIAAQGGK